MVKTENCIICLQTCRTKAILQLRCDCKYTVHYRCINRWHKRKPRCIICRTPCGQPFSRHSTRRRTLTPERRPYRSHLIQRSFRPPPRGPRRFSRYDWEHFGPIETLTSIRLDENTIHQGFEDIFTTRYLNNIRHVNNCYYLTGQILRIITVIIILVFFYYLLL